jgi:hypothetical protein
MKRTLSLLLIVLSLCLLTPPTQSTLAFGPDHRFGVVDAHTDPRAASELGAGWTRITFRWDKIQPDSPDQWELPITEDQLALELSQGRQVVGMVTHIPTWAVDPAARAKTPYGLETASESPDNLWATFLRSLVQHYAGLIDHWIIGNEPNVRIGDDLTWNGSLEDFGQLVRVAYHTIKQANPEATVHLGAFAERGSITGQGPFLARFLQVFASDPDAEQFGYYFDIATLNTYSQPEQVYDLLISYRGAMQDFRIDKPIWLVEANLVPSNDPAWPVESSRPEVSLNDQSAFIVQAAALAIAGGADRISIFKLADTAESLTQDTQPYGLVRSDGTRRPAFTAYQVAATYLAGFRSAQWERQGPMSFVVVDRGEQTTTVVWSLTSDPQTALVPAYTTRGLLVDTLGGAWIVYPERGFYAVELPGCTSESSCPIGGLPLLLVEDSPDQSTSEPLPPSPTIPPVTPPAIPTATLAPTYTPTPEPSPSPTPMGIPSPTFTPTPTPHLTPTSTPDLYVHPVDPLPTSLSFSALPVVGIILAVIILAGVALRRE